MLLLFRGFGMKKRLEQSAPQLFETFGFAIVIFKGIR